MFFLKKSASLKSLILLTAVFTVGCATNVVETTTPSPSEEVTQTQQDRQRIDQQLDLIEALLAEQQVEEATVLLNDLDFDSLNTAQQTRYALSQANAALVLGDGQQALTWLSGDYVYLFDGLPLEQQITIGLKRAEAYEYSGKPLAAARERIFMAPLLEGEQADYNHDQIWFDLQLVPEESLRELVKTESSPDLTGWIELSLISLTHSDDLYRLLTQVEDWQNRKPAHPAAKRLPGSLSMLRELAAGQPKHIGVLLPLSGPLEKAGNAIRNGLLTSWYQARDAEQDVPTLTFYDTAKTEDVQNLYKQAITNGAETIIGPLAKARVHRLADAESLPVPVLALNYSDRPAKDANSFYQFGLSPEDEATQVADDIWQQGVRSVLVVAPNSAWGIRTSDAFIRHWQLKGGTVTSKALFERPDQYLGVIKQALNIDHSERRHQQLQYRLDEPLEFEFRRRDDVDMVFMLAFPAQARQLKPILNYQRAIDIPVVATSSIYAGTSDADRDKDLEGIRFIEMPWRLRPSTLRSKIGQAFPESLSSYSSLIAFGIDAYRLYPRLPQMAVFDDVRIQGVTGSLSMADNGLIRRNLDWAVIENGLVRPRNLTIQTSRRP
ncbi:penicillin-binding protein activator [Reinekea blandensis]|uniref:Lipoprotein n=1 Tax=Reinekea blandensis MED297 TaxID=314283 RepID=A4BFS5_9GAMM|nr:penicillin-binding protein activator [Reinekea blandensis]EAR08943.1 hypothetical protein MED297_03602 [Reinekea sp. MED297] [Reinekea blandensis MED297]